MTNEDETAGAEFAAYYAVLIEEQDARKASIEQRGLAVITTSGTLSTLLFGLVAVVTKATDLELPTVARIPLGVAIIAFVLAAVLALLTNIPRKYVNVVVGDPDDDLWPHWEDSRNKALKRITATRAKAVSSAQAVNGEKAKLLFRAMIAEVIAVVAVAVAVIVILMEL